MQNFTFKEIDNGTYCVMSYDGDEAIVTVPREYWGKPVTVLFDHLFAGHTEITQVNLPDTITDIGRFVFDGCTSLKTIDLPDSLDEMWQYAFARSSITEITLPKNLRHVSPFVFFDCKELKKVECNETLRDVDAYAFGGCEKLKDFRFSPATRIHAKAFEKE